jgi:hypothetical protein
VSRPIGKGCHTTIEMSPDCSFTVPRKRSVFSCFDSDSFSTDDRPRGCRTLVWGMEARGKGQRLFLRSSLERPKAVHKTLNPGCDNGSGFCRLHLSHQNVASARGPVLASLLQLQDEIVVAHHPILTDHAFFLQPEDLAGFTAEMLMGFAVPMIRREESRRTW